MEPFYPKSSSSGGRPPIGIDRMLRIHFLQHWFELSDPVAEETLNDSYIMRQCVGIDLGTQPVVDETTF
ncbi:transposase [Teredinibacter turnerae]|uniref:transposase n=1 Tax=Teredinibacter turnerae TaxID=2426 RepID=UPI003B006403